MRKFFNKIILNLKQKENNFIFFADVKENKTVSLVHQTPNLAAILVQIYQSIFKLFLAVSSFKYIIINYVFNKKSTIKALLIWLQGVFAGVTE